MSNEVNSQAMELDFTDPQKEFMKAKTPFVGYGGARGGGKSWALQHKIMLLALKYAGIRIL